MALRRYVRKHERWSSTLLAVEAHRAGSRLGIDTLASEDALRAVTTVFPSETTHHSARTIGVRELRTLDAVHLASALEFADDLAAVITYDRRLAAGCEYENVDVVSPGLGAFWWH